MKELDDILAGLVDDVDGAVVAAVGAMDGLLVERYPAQGPDLAITAAELTDILKGSHSAFSVGLAAGALLELVVMAERRVGYVRLLDDDLYCLIVMEPEGNLGEARVQAERAAHHILEVLA